MDQTPSQRPTLFLTGAALSGNGALLSDRTGQQVGNYRLIRRLARGGFAEVYLGEHVHLGTYAAIKILDALLEEGDLEAFGKEARIVAHLRHPHIVSIFDYAVHEGIPFLVMEYAPNGTLRQRHLRGQSLPPITALGYLKQIASALQYAHNECLIHCDIKPENMLIGHDDELLLSDFGIAVVTQSSRLYTPQKITGTISYMAPEHLQGQPCTASDQYALGVVAYEWLCGECPFRGSAAEILAQHINVMPASLQARVPGISPELEAVVLTTLAKEPEQRYPSVLDFVAAFELALQPQAQQGPARSKKAKRSATTIAATAKVVRTSLEAQPGQRLLRLSRRTLLGLASLATAGLIGGGVAWLTHLHAPMHSLSAQALNLASTLTTHPPGTRLLTYYGHSRTVNAVAWMPQAGTCVASASSDHSVQVWFASSGITLTNYSGHTDVVHAVAWSPDGTQIASGSADMTVQIWNALDGSRRVLYRAHSAAILAVAWSPDGSRIASASADMTVRIWNASNGQTMTMYANHTNSVLALAWSPDGEYIASASADMTVRIWNASNGNQRLIYRKHMGIVNAVAWSPDGERIASGSADMTIQVWEATTGRQFFSQHNGGIVNAVAWSPDGSRIASGSADMTARIWNASNATGTYMYHGHKGGVNALSWSPTGAAIASGSTDHTVQVWQAI